MNPLTVILVHSPEDRETAAELASFLERGAAVALSLDEGEIRRGEGLVARVDYALSAEAVLVLLSPDAAPSRWIREEWTPVFHETAQQNGVALATVLCRACRFPDLLRRRNFFDLTRDRRAQFRCVKQWLLGLRRPTTERGFVPARQTWFRGRETELELLRTVLGDMPGTIALRHGPGAGKTSLALEFCRRHAGDFESLVWVGCRGRSLAAITGEAARQSGLRLTGDTAQNLSTIRQDWSQRRLLVVLDDVEEEAALQLVAGGSSSTLVTTRHAALLSDTARIDFEAHVRQEHSPLSGDEVSLLEAASACSAHGFRAELAAEIAGFDGREALEGLMARGLVLPLDDAGPRYLLTADGRRKADHLELPHAAAVRDHFRRWSSEEAGREADLPELQLAFERAIGRRHEKRWWELAMELATLGASLCRRWNRPAEAFELSERLAVAADETGDRGLLENLAWERYWILLAWDRQEEASSLLARISVHYSDQMGLGFEPREFASFSPLREEASIVSVETDRERRALERQLRAEAKSQLPLDFGA